MRRSLSAVVAVCVLAGASGSAGAAWITGSPGSAYAFADAVPAGPAPVVSASGRDVLVEWDAVLFDNGTAAGAYIVRRFRASDGEEADVAAGCAGTVEASSCTETGVAPGEWIYRITAVHGHWTGPQGQGTAVTVEGVRGSFVLKHNAPGQDGKADYRDTIEITYDELIDVGTFCSSWSGNSVSRTISADDVVTVEIRRSRDGDIVTVSTSDAACGGSFRFGEVNLGHQGQYVAGPNGSIARFRGAGSNASTIEWRPGTKQLVVTLGQETTNSSVRVGSSTVATYYPDPGHTANGRPIDGPFVTAEVRQF